MRMTFTGVVCAVLAVGATGLASPGAPTATADEAPRIRAARVMENLGRGVVAVRSGTAHGLVSRRLGGGAPGGDRSRPRTVDPFQRLRRGDVGVRLHEKTAPHGKLKDIPRTPTVGAHT